MRNLNACDEWLLGHVRAGSEQASNAPLGMNDTATGYETEDAAAAGNYDQFGGHPRGGRARRRDERPDVGSRRRRPACRHSIRSPTSAEPTAKPWPGSWRPAPGPFPATTAAGRLAALAARAQAANVSLVNAQAELLATGECRQRRAWPRS